MMLRRFRLLLLGILSIVLFATCQTTKVAPAGTCPNGNSDPRAPAVCVDDADLRNLGATPDNAPANRGVVVHWRTKSGGGNLSIVFDDAKAVGNITCTPGGGHCFATTLSDAEYGKHKYSIVIASGKKTYSLDPTLEIKP